MLPCFASYFKNFTINDGLSQSIIFNIKQDKTGFLWLSTQDGLNKFDGRNFSVFRQISKVPSSINDNYIYPLLVDKQELLLGTRTGGLNILDLTTYKATKLNSHILNDSSKRITALEKSFNGVWIATYDGQVFFKSSNGNKLESLNIDNNKPVYALLETKNKELWVGTHGAGVFVYSSNKELIAQYSQDSIDNPIHNSIFDIYQDRKSQVWLASQGGGLYQYTKKTNNFINWQSNPADKTTLSHNELRAIKEDSQGQLWLATRGGGVNLFDQKSNKFTHLRHKPNDPNSLLHDRVYSIFEDQNRNLWFGTAKGLSMLSSNSQVFNRLQSPILNSNDIWALFEDSEERLWVGSWNGIDLLDSNLEQLKDLPQGIAKTLRDKAIKSIVQDNSGDYWLATWNSGLLKLSADLSKIQIFKHNDNQANSISNNSIYSLLHDSLGHLWIGTNGGGLNVYDKKRKIFQNSKSNYAAFPDIKQDKITSLYEDYDRNLWVGTDDEGAYRFSLTDKSLVKVNMTNGLNNNSVKGFLSIKDDIWIATSNGLSKYSLSSNKIVNYSVDDGLPNQVIYSLLADNDNNLWLSTNAGLARFDLKTSKFYNFDFRDGLQGNEFNAGAAVKLKNTHLVFAGPDGAVEFSPEKLQEILPSEKVAINSIAYSGLDHKNVYDLHAQVSILNKTHKITLDHNVKRISLDIVSLDFNDIENTFYKYKLDYFDDEWLIKKSKNLELTYTNLAAGSYALKVFVGNRAGVSKFPFVFNIEVTKAPWFTWWAWLLYCSVLCGLVIGFFYYKARHFERRKLILENQVQLRTQKISEQRQFIEEQAEQLKLTLIEKQRFFNYASHELKTPLSLIISPLQGMLTTSLSDYQRQQIKTALKSSEKLKSMVNKLLAIAKHQTIEEDALEAVNISQIAQKLLMEFEVAAISKSLTLTSSIEDDLIVLATYDGIEAIINNLLSNSIKYCEQGEVILEIKLEDTRNIKVSILDTGIGIASLQQERIFDYFDRGDQAESIIEGSGVGLSLVRLLASKFNATINVESKKNIGSCFTLLIPQQLDNLCIEKPTVNNSIIEIPEQKNKKVLIVEDNDELLKYLEIELQEYYQVITANCAEAGLIYAEQDVPDLIISDLVMPGLNGQEMVEKLRENILTCHIPIIILSAVTNRNNRLSLLQASSLDFLEKPFDRDELLLKISNWLKFQDVFKKSIQAGEEVIEMRLDEKDVNLIARLDSILNEFYFEPELSVAEIAKELALSERQLQRKMKALLGLSPIEYIRQFRLKIAKQFIAQDLPINLVVNKVGFASRSHFTSSFKKQFSMTPSEYKKSLKLE